jgi:ABC-2 type transport system permease protein
MSSATSAERAPAPASGRVSFVATARVLVQLAWARTRSPVLLVGIGVLVLLPMFFALVFASRGVLSGDPVEFLVRRYDELVCALATPLIALLFGTSAFSAEADDGTLLYLVTTTTPRWWIVAVRTVFASVLTGAVSALAVWGTGAIAVGSSDPEQITSAFTLAVFYGGATYAALFTALALLTRRALVSGLVYVIFWEGVLSGTFPALRYLSVRQWMLAVAAEFTDVSDTRLAGGPSVWFALGASVVVVLFTVYVGGRRLHQPRIGRVGT